MKKDKIDLLLSMQEHPEKYSEEQLKQMLADDPELAELREQLAQTKRALMKREVDEEDVAVNEEWKKFVGEHTAEMDRPQRGMFFKVAASIVGILLMAGVTFAAIHIVRTIVGPNNEPEIEQTVKTGNAPSTSEVDERKDGKKVGEPIVFDNVPLEKMLTQIAAYYGKEVEFRNDDARQLRFYFVWRKNETMDATLRRLNLFESITIELNDNKLIVK